MAKAMDVLISAGVANESITLYQVPGESVDLNDHLMASAETKDLAEPAKSTEMLPPCTECKKRVCLCIDGYKFE